MASAPGDPTARPLKPSSLWLDLFRWSAAFVVMWSHAGGILLLRTGQVSHPSPIHWGYSFVAGYAHYAVMVFFVMSGFLVGGSAWAEIKRSGGLDLWTYAQKRVVRLTIVLYPVLLLSASLIPLSRSMWPGAFHDAITNPTTFACNSVFLQEALCTRYGGNDSLWSLFHEFWYYVAFPLMALGLVSTGWRRVALVAASLGLLAGLQAIQWHNVPILPYFSIWLLGWAIAVMPKPRWLIQPLPAAALFLAVLSVVRFGRDHLGHNWALGFALDLLVALTFANMVLSMKWSEVKPPPFGALHKHLAGFSYSLYCVHFPLIAFYAAVCMSLFGFGADMDGTKPVHWLVVAGGLAFAVAGAFGLYQLTEKHTDAVRKRLFTRQPKPAPVGAN